MGMIPIASVSVLFNRMALSSHADMKKMETGKYAAKIAGKIDSHVLGL